MKQKRLLFILVPFVLLTLNSCTSYDCHLSYGTYIEQDLNSLRTLSNQELYDKGVSEREHFLLAVYQGSYVDDCLCWSTFQNTIVSYMNKYHEYVYLFDAQGQDSSVSSFKIDKVNDSSPHLYVFSGTHVIAKYSYKNNRDEKLFSNPDILYNKVHEKAKKPHIYYVDDAYLKENLSNLDQSLVLFARNGCSDCSYVLPHVIIPYFRTAKTTKNILLFDMQNYYELSKSETASEEEKAQYQDLKDYYELSASSNATYGYQQGVVPTIQYREKGVVKDVSIFFNDVISQKDDGSYVISDSFYTNERLQNLNYLKGKQMESVLKGKIIESEYVMQTKSGGYYWLQDNAAIYHSALLNTFLDYYLL